MNTTLASPQDSVPCSNCGYELAGLPSDGSCPECAHSVAESRTLIAGGIPSGRVKGIAAALLRSGNAASYMLYIFLFGSVLAGAISSLFPAYRVWCVALCLGAVSWSGWVMFVSIRSLRANLSPIHAFSPFRSAAAYAEHSTLALAIFTSIYFTGAVGKNLPFPAVARGMGVAMDMAEVSFRLVLLAITFVHLRAIFPVMRFLVARVKDSEMLKKLKSVTGLVPILIILSAAHFIIRYTPLKSFPGVGWLGFAFMGLWFVWFRYANLLTTLAKTYTDKQAKTLNKQPA